MPDTPPTKVDRERAMLERHLLVPRHGRELLFPGLWADDRWIAGVALLDTWTPVFAEPGMPFLGKVPLSWHSAHVVAALGIGKPSRLSPLQREEWAAAGRDPERTWGDACGLPIDDPHVALMASPLLDDLAREHGKAPARAKRLHTVLATVVDGLRALTLERTEQTSADGYSGPWRVGTLGQLLDLYNQEGADAFLAFDVPTLIATLERWAERVARVAHVEHAFLPPRGKTRDYKRWSGAVVRLAAFLRLRRGREMNYLAIVAALEWHGHDLGAGSLELKKKHVMRALARRRNRRRA